MLWLGDGGPQCVIWRSGMTSVRGNCDGGRGRKATAGLPLVCSANALQGMDRASAARLAGMNRQTLRDWVHRSPRLIFGLRFVNVDPLTSMLIAMARNP